VDEGTQVLRIVVAQAGRGGADDRSPSEIVAALSRLDGDVELELCHDAHGCRALIDQRRIDLVIVDSDLGREAQSILERASRAQPPMLLLDRAGDDASRLGTQAMQAAHRLRVDDDFHDRLPGAALRAMRRSEPIGPESQAPPPYEQSIIQNMNSALLVVDRAGRVTSANTTAERILGVRDQGIVGRSVWEWFDAEDRAQALIHRTLEQGEHFKGAETRVARADGRIVPIGISCTPLLGRDGSTLGAVAIFQDLTEVEQLRSHSLQTEKMASIGQLAAGVAHEINNPMGFIHANLFQMSEYITDLRRLWGHVGRLQEAAEKGDATELHDAREALAAASNEADVEFLLSDFSKALLECQEGSERIRHIVQDLRDFSHRETGELMLADINQCIDSTANIVWTTMKHCVELEKDYAELPQLRCYPMQIKQVFMNLLVNAYQSIEEVVGNSGEMGRVRVCTRHREGGIAIEVHDSGTGIAPADLDRIFDPFFTTKQVGSGTGLGLSTSYRIVEQHGGSLRASSVLGEGSCFEVWLPEQGAGEDELDA
jgi:PAS domain S-box-containing protein